VQPKVAMAIGVANVERLALGIVSQLVKLSGEAGVAVDRGAIVEREEAQRFTALGDDCQGVVEGMCHNWEMLVNVVFVLEEQESCVSRDSQRVTCSPSYTSLSCTHHCRGHGLGIALNAETA